MARRPAIAVSFAMGYRPAPARMLQWRALAPKYADFYEALQELARRSKRSDSCGSAMLVRLAGIHRSKLQAMLAGAKLLGFVEQLEPELFPTHYSLRALPPLWRLGEVIDELKALHVPPWHGNSLWMEETWELYLHWCLTFKRDRERNYKRDAKLMVEEVHALKRLVAATGLPEKLKVTMELFIEQHPALELHRHKEWREYGTTLLTFCALYGRLVRRLERKGVIDRDQDELNMEARRRAKAARKWSRRAKN